ncbi:MAG: NADH-quinone oxidoreductase subunit NuoE [Candidatus Natronoplasma sp.]
MEEESEEKRKKTSENEELPLRREVKSVLKEYPVTPSSLIPILQQCQDRFGYLPRDVIEEIADYLEMPSSKVYGVATFYAQFRFEPLGDHMIRVCHGTACHVKGAEEIGETIENHLGVETGETTEDGLFTLERVACLGCCSLAPVMMVDDTAHGNLTREKARDIIQEYREEGE